MPPEQGGGGGGGLGVSTPIKAKEPSRAIFAHCYHHYFKLNVGFMIKEVKNFEDLLRNIH